jgi:hypothetical protein
LGYFQIIIPDQSVIQTIVLDAEGFADIQIVGHQEALEIQYMAQAIQHGQQHEEKRRVVILIIQ